MKDIKDMNFYSKMKAFARLQLKKRWIVPILITLVSVAISNLLSLPVLINLTPILEQYLDLLQNADLNNLPSLIQSMDSLPSIYSFLTFLQKITSYIFLFASIKVFLQIAKEPTPVSASDYLKGFNSFFKAILIGYWITLWILLWFLFVVFVFSLITGFLLGLLKNLAGTKIIQSIIPIFFGIWALVILLRKYLSYSFTFYIACEHESVGVRKAMTLSKIITKDNLLKIFLLQLSFIGWYFIPTVIYTVITILVQPSNTVTAIISSIVFGVFSLFLTPYQKISEINAYHVMLQEKMDNKILFQEDFE